MHRIRAPTRGVFMKRILVLYYSQSGDVRRAAESFVRPLIEAGVELTWEELRPRVEYPSPWRSFQRFFDVMPECVAGLPPPICPPCFDPDQRFDLVLLAYQVWFLSPSLPVQGFFRTEHARVLRDSKVVTLCVCRNMWQVASQTMKRLLRETGAVHIDNVVVTHQGPPMATFVTTTRSLVSGKRDRLLGVLPEAGIHAAELAGLERFGRAIAGQFDALDGAQGRPLLRGLRAVTVNRKYVLPELFGWCGFRTWSRLIRGMGKIGGPCRRLGIMLFGISLPAAIILGIPAMMLGGVLLHPFIRRPLARYIAQLEKPSG